MNLSLTMTLRPELHQRLSLRQSISQRLTLKMQLFQTIRGEEFRPKAKCPNCGHDLSPAEILMGFKRDPVDTTTKCPECATRFQPLLMSSNASGRIEIHFYCPQQTLEMLWDYHTRMSPGEIRHKQPAMYLSAMFHFGGLKAAFAKKGWDYAFDEFPGWEEKVAAFLGTCPDQTIAEVCGVDKARVTALRKKLGIKMQKQAPVEDEEAEA